MTDLEYKKHRFNGIEWNGLGQNSRMKQNRKGQKMIGQSVKEQNGMEQKGTDMSARIHHIKSKWFLECETFLGQLYTCSL